MALPIPVLDDRRYEDIRRDLVAEIPRVEEGWSDHNPSDPGIATLELLAAMAELISYRLDQVSDAVVRNFLRLVVDRPEPVTVGLRFTRELPSAALAALPGGVVFPPALGNRIEHDAALGRLVFRGAMNAADRVLLEGLSADPAYRAAIAELSAVSNRTVVVPAGTRVGGAATAEVYETVTEARIPPARLSVDVTARHRQEMPARALGSSDGSAGQSFALMDPVPVGGAVRPVLLDPARQGSDVYDPNPEVTVAGAVWRYRQDLLEAGAADRVFTVEPLTYRVAFGDGVRGAIPPAGDAIACPRHQVVRGKEVQVPAGALTVIVQTRVRLLALPPAAAALVPGVSYDAARGLLLAAGPISVADRDALLALDPDPVYQEAVRSLHEASVLAVANPGDAFGGRFLFTMENAGREGLAAVREPERAITAADFGDLASRVLAELSGLPGPKVKRCHARRLDDVGTVAVIVVPEPASAADRWPLPSLELKRRVYGFLDRRRLITTRLLVGDPRYRAIALRVEVVPERNVDAAALSGTIREALNRRFDPIAGGEDGAGWPLGRAIHRSEIFERVSNIEGVDHVEAVRLDGREADVVLAPLELPRIDVLSSSVEVRSAP